MVSKHNTARTRPTEPFWLGQLSQHFKDPQRGERYAYLMKLAGNSLAIQVIRNLLKNNEAFNLAKAANKPPAPGAWPLSPTQIDGLCAALYVLHRHGDAIMRAEHEG
ncbi:hypothetical protein [Dyella flagellata]|uniref:Uncharacterized protein n=1 Tax=Dyella flagellata TaxID=1867833 RepID=A0ABQ5XCS8_9GAMM|nr:hypothetical protein [Dyella flagellata]GLQ88234.1 hypothetical protein GCM10007898_18030 [Dyella flagellata]